jgi:hypothetical protein
VKNKAGRGNLTGLSEGGPCSPRGRGLGSRRPKKAKDAAQTPEQESGESRIAMERRLEEPGMRRVLKDPLYGPPKNGADTSASGKGVRLPRSRQEGGSQRKAEDEKKDGTSLEKIRSENKPS